jgi:hypothetical protein
MNVSVAALLRASSFVIIWQNTDVSAHFIGHCEQSEESIMDSSLRRAPFRTTVHL